ncbi:type VI secretion system ImpA family N-terminal domain-containing protein [uncultured Alsobacter sp.]|uniref:type VI secretion system protein TssA n=1 Tax=uncultured Alsobacter sp. TaxID=1748258 RepID=UPI0025E8DC98|nr:type VI secretion system ImpA family N-terminal domain-containing protein [uncultured Alsobacter sp.]
MALIDLSSLVQPIDGDLPTGPDLDFEGDPEFVNFVARIESQLPTSYFLFDRSKIAFQNEYDVISGLLARTRDLRLLSILARLQILNKDVEGFRASLAASAALLRERWDEVHPRAESGDYLFRMIALQALDDAPTVLLPLTHVPIIVNKRVGQILYRTVQLSQGKAAPFIGQNEKKEEIAETVLEPGVVERAMLEVSPDELRTRRVIFADIQASAKAIASITRDKAAENWVPLDKLLALLAEIIGYIDGFLGRLEPSAAVETGGAAGGAESEDGAEAGSSAAPRLRGRVKTHAHAAAALGAVESYLATSEPSNPSLLIVRQARDLIGKSFIDVLRALEPNFAEQAVFVIGTSERLVIPLERLAPFGASPDTSYEQSDESYDQSGSSYEQPEASEESSDESWSSEAQPEEEAGAETPSQEGGEEAAEPAAMPVHAAPVPVAPLAFVAVSRQDALALLADVEAFYRQAEPSSPIPVLLGRVRDLTNKDFLSILKDIIPATLLRPESSE